MTHSHATKGSARSIRRWWSLRWVRFCLVGVLNTAASYGLYCLLLAVGLNYVFASLGSLALGIIFSYTTHSALVFRQTSRDRFLRYLALWAALYGLNVAILTVLLDVGFGPYLAGAINLPLMVLLSYFAQRFFVFRGARMS
ncbi:GtrA family protein [Pseudoduganella sp. UC29_106]|uniref:GtrA family protein n=1 Tax=Pseudoduganella sp. UC29_106 TaxID=3374553 RepID=UPI003756F05A